LSVKLLIINFYNYEKSLKNSNFKEKFDRFSMKVTQQYAHPILHPHQAELLAEESQTEPGCPGMASVPWSQTRT